jgi:hypothetical protein
MIGFLGNAYLWVKAAHIIFAIFLMAGMFMMPRFFVYHQECEPGSDEDRKWIEREDKLRRIIVNPSILILWILGLMLMMNIGAWSEVCISRNSRKRPRRTGRNGRRTGVEIFFAFDDAPQDIMFGVDPQGMWPRMASRSWVSARSRCCPMVSASCAAPKRTISPGRTTSMSRPTRSANGPAHRRYGRRRDPRAQGWRALFRADQADLRSTSTIPMWCATASTSTT